MNHHMRFPCAALPYVPHSGSMCLLDTLEAYDGTMLQASVVIGPEATFYRASPTRASGQRRARNGVPNWVGMEYMAQAIAAFAGLRARGRGEEVKIGFLVSARRVDFAVDVFPSGQTLQVFAREVVMAANGLATFDCRIAADDDEWARARINVYQPEDADAYLAEAAQGAEVLA